MKAFKTFFFGRFLTIIDFEFLLQKIENMPMTLSIEEQKVQNSIMRLNERLNSKLNDFI